MSLVFYPRLWLWPHPHLNKLQAHSELFKMPPKAMSLWLVFTITFDVSSSSLMGYKSSICSLHLLYLCKSYSWCRSHVWWALHSHALPCNHAWPGWHALCFIANGLRMPWDRLAWACICLAEDANTLPLSPCIQPSVAMWAPGSIQIQQESFEKRVEKFDVLVW